MCGHLCMYAYVSPNELRWNLWKLSDSFAKKIHVHVLIHFPSSLQISLQCILLITLCNTFHVTPTFFKKLRKWAWTKSSLTRATKWKSYFVIQFMYLGFCVFELDMCFSLRNQEYRINSKYSSTAGLSKTRETSLKAILRNWDETFPRSCVLQSAFLISLGKYNFVMIKVCFTICELYDYNDILNKW